MRPVPADSQVVIRTGAGGGWGDPLERDPEMVLQDVRSGFVSVEGALRDYGVVIDAGAHLVDHAGTENARATSRSAQGGRA